MRTVLVIVAVVVFTPYYAALVLLAALFRVPHRDDGVYVWAPRAWSRWICRAAGVRVVTHGFERLNPRRPLILIANHVSWFDVFSLASTLPRYAFVAKAELGRIPLFGVAARACGQVFIERANRKAAFAVYDGAAARIREGTTVVIFPEGTRGSDYALRPFKKGPFVLAVAAGAPVVPLLIHGSLAVNRRGSAAVHGGEIHIHVLDEVPTEGFSYDDRNLLAARAYEVMRNGQQALYGISSPKWNPSSRLQCPPSPD